MTDRLTESPQQTALAQRCVEKNVLVRVYCILPICVMCIFRLYLKLHAAEYEESFLTFKSDRVTWYRPTLLTDLLELKYKYPTARLVVGNTEIGQRIIIVVIIVVVVVGIAIVIRYRKSLIAAVKYFLNSVKS